MPLINPEFQRQLWLRFSPFRLAAMPVLLALISWSLSVGEGPWAENLLVASLALYFGAVGLWANHEAGMAFAEEVKDNTWDFQRMSSITPWQLTLGKLLGSVSYAWYYAAALLGIFLFAYNNLPARTELLAGQAQAPDILHIVFFMLLAGVMGNATSLLNGLLGMTRGNYTGKAGKRVRSLSSLVLGAAVSGFIFYRFVLISLFAPDKFSSWALNKTAVWYNMPVNAYLFFLLTLLFFAFWIVMAAYRIIKKELLFKVTPVVWVAFMLSLTVYFFGMGDQQPRGYPIKLLVAYYVILATAYVLMFTEASDLSLYKRLLQNFRAGNIRGMAENMPRWLASLLVALVTGLAVMAAQFWTSPHRVTYQPFLTMIPCLLFFIRDGIVVHLIALNRKSRSPGFILVVYYLMAYAILPSLHGALVGGGPGSMKKILALLTGGDISYLGWYYPALPTGVSGLLPPTVEIFLLMAGIVWYSGRKRARVKADAHIPV